MEGVYCAVRAEYSSIIYLNVSVQRHTKHVQQSKHRNTESDVFAVGSKTAADALMENLRLQCEDGDSNVWAL